MNTLRELELEINRWENHLFGVELYYNGVVLLHGHDQAIIDLTKYHYDQIMERGSAALSNAKILLGQVKIGTKAESEIGNFSFPPIDGPPELSDLTIRAKILAETYDSLFPEKSRQDASGLSQEETMHLMNKSADKLF